MATVGLTLLLAVLVVGLVLVAVAAGHHAVRGARTYLIVVSQVLGVPDPGTARPAATLPANLSRVGPATAQPEPAFRHYLFGPAGDDLRLLLQRTRSELTAEFERSSALLWTRWWQPGRGRRLYCLIRIYGLVLGTLVGAILVTAVTAVQLIGLAVPAGVILAGIGGLRAVDTVLLQVRKIRITCPACYRRVGYPAYRCPGCGAWHRDVRPGRYGVLRRRCRCRQQTLPTLLLLGSHELPAFCPYPDCRTTLADSSGTAAELLLPIIGGQNAGKTRLLAAMVTVLQQGATRGGPAVGFADRTSERRLDQLRPALLAGENTRPTPPERPRAFSLYITDPQVAAEQPDRSRLPSALRPAALPPRRLLHLFDTAGENFYDSEVLAELGYLGAARTFLLVIDPLSVPSVWAGLDQDSRDRLEPVRARRSPEFVFGQLLDNLERMLVNPKRARVAVALHKADLLPGAGIPSPVPDSAGVQQWLEDASLDNLVRSIRHSFGEVRYFHTSAMLDADDQATGVPELIEWLLTETQPTRRPRGAQRGSQRRQPKTPGHQASHRADRWLNPGPRRWRSPDSGREAGHQRGPRGAA